MTLIFLCVKEDEIFEKKNDISSQGRAAVSRHIKDVGRLLTATELRSADRYWHVRQNGERTGIYPSEYKPFAVGIMWNMMAQVSVKYSHSFMIYFPTYRLTSPYL